MSSNARQAKPAALSAATQSLRKGLSKPAAQFEPQYALLETRLCIPDDQLVHLAGHCCAPMVLPSNAPVPRQGEVLYLNSTSAWGVTMVIHEWLSPSRLRIEVWLEHVGAARFARADDSASLH